MNFTLFGRLRPPAKDNKDKKLDEILATLSRVFMDTQALNQKIEAITAQLEKANAELDAAKARDEQTRQALEAEIASLKASLENVQIPAETEAAIGRLAGIAQAIDDRNPDAPVSEPAPAPTPVEEPTPEPAPVEEAVAAEDPAA